MEVGSDSSETLVEPDTPLVETPRVKRTASARLWAFTILTGAAATFLANTYFHLLPTRSPRPRQLGTLVVDEANGRMVLLDLSSRQESIEVNIPPWIRSSADRGYVDSSTAAVGNHYTWWQASTNKFWTSASTVNIKANRVQSAISTYSGDGTLIGMLFGSRSEDLDLISPSPDGRLFAYQATRWDHNGNGSVHLSIYDRTAKKAFRISSDGGGRARWDASGERLTYACNIDHGPRQVCIYNLAKRLQSVLLTPGVEAIETPSFAPDGRSIAAVGLTGSEVSPTLIQVNIATDEVTTIVRDGRSIQTPEFSPDGRLIAFTTPKQVIVRDLATGTEHVVLRPTDDPGGLEWTSDEVSEFGVK